VTRVKIYHNQQLSDFEKNINEFLKKEEVKKLIDVKFVSIGQNDVDNYAALILYEENMNSSKEDPQIHE